MSEPASKVLSLRRTIKDSRKAVLDHAANELVFAVVGHAGSGTTAVAQTIVDLLCESSVTPARYDVEIIKATDIIADWARRTERQLPSMDNGRKTLQTVDGFQNLGDAMRLTTRDHAAVAKGFAVAIRQTRAKKVQTEIRDDVPVIPDGVPRAYVLDSIRHPAEVELLRHVYQDAFFLIGVVCEDSKRLDRVTAKYPDAGRQRALQFMERDAKAIEPHGQRVSAAFHLADFYVDNTADRHKDDGTANEEWEVAEKLSRLMKIIRHSEIMRPEVGETAMAHAHSAGLRSACLSRQVGAALMDRDGNIVATGCNEVPRAGGGVYGTSFAESAAEDHRCAYRQLQGHDLPFCSSTQSQNAIIATLLDEIQEIRSIDDNERKRLSNLFRDGPIGRLLEFSRAVHAEMDALLSAARKGATTVGTRLFVTTFPCHYCARHIVGAGVDEVQFIEPYPKSQALLLHADSIAIRASAWQPPSSALAHPGSSESGATRRVSAKVLFRPFTGVAPRLYKRAFAKDRELKDGQSGNLSIQSPDWGSPWHLRRVGYAQLEAELSQEGW